MASHDIVAQRDYLPKLRDVPVEVDEDEETVKLVQLVKSQEPLVRITYELHYNIFENKILSSDKWIFKDKSYLGFTMKSKDEIFFRLELSIIFVRFDIHTKLECRILPNKFGSC